MKGSVSDEIEVKVAAKEVWQLYGGLELARVAQQKLPHILHKIDIFEGDGGVGTVLKLTLPPDTPGFTSYSEKFTVVDNEKMVKETEVVEGGYLNLGFTLFRCRLEIIETSPSSCITRATIEYELKEEFAANASLVSINVLMAIVNVASEYLLKNQQIDTKE